MKLRSLVLRVMLTILIIISLVLTWYIWYNPSHFAHQQSSGVTVQQTSKTTTEQAKQDAFLPTGILWQGVSQKQQLYATGEGMPSRTRKVIASWQVTKMGTITKLGTDAYNDYLTLPQSLQLTYRGLVSWSLMNGLLFKQSNVRADYTFDRIIIDTKNQHVYLANDYHQTVRRLSMTHTNYGAIVDLVAAATTKRAVTEQRFDHHEAALMDDSITVKPQTFLIDKQSATHYISLLMTGTATTSSVDTKQIGNQTIYTVNSNQRLAVDRDDNMMQYENFAAGSQKTTYHGILSSAFDAMSSLSLASTQGVRYFSYNTAESAVTFRTYVQGIPVFNQTSDGTVRVVHTMSSKRIEFSGSNLEAAIPTDQTAVTLPSGSTVLDKLRSLGAQPSDIDDITIGYKWQKDTNSGLVVNLEPTYYININGTYVDYNDLVDGTVDIKTLLNSN